MIQRKTSTDNKDYFVVVANNGEPLATSETYESKQGMEKGIAALKKAVREECEDEYSEGICDYGPVILKNGQPMTMSEILSELINRP